MCPNQIQISASNRGITDHFFCFVCDQHVWDCDHLLKERITAPRIHAPDGSQFRSFAYDGRSRVLEIEFGVTIPHAYDGIPLPPPPCVIQYAEVPRYVFMKLIRSRTARRQERFWADAIQRRYKGQTVRTVCRLPRIFRIEEAKNIRPSSFEDYLTRMSSDEQQALQIVVAAMRVFLLLRTLAPRRVAALGGLAECQSCQTVGAGVGEIRHRNCLWFGLASGSK